ncbi:DUF4160 domain-containing protein [Azospirillum argentinense]|uniref:DUF4160 domain-containing protein n=1 Tax=Azospirillum brasilense TaxID=192 RepID=A0A4D8Q4J3_AZOBR|nr:DUF4160 domain-containing protein [Azospirillum argentinense]QCO04191.1 DUF4160 domain-containing protein [Azospirillum argentinense]
MARQWPRRLHPPDPLPPHFHVKGTDFEALVTIATLEVIASDLPAATRKEVLAWAAANRAALVTEWNTWNPNIPFA